MGYTRRQYITSALEEIGLAEYAYDLSPEQLQSGSKRLDSLWAEWNGRGIRLGAPIGSVPGDPDLDEQTYIPDFANEAIILNLAVRLAPMYGKTPSMETKIAAKNALNLVLSRMTMPQEMQMPGSMPAGAGNRQFGNGSPFLTPPTDPLLAGPDSVIEFD